jgi:hypothetical protein
MKGGYGSEELIKAKEAERALLFKIHSFQQNSIFI